ncbi:MAG: hypothetical protein M1812_007762 [Candelaria pacifica]|nr:MAG: hypothetical protein M1812_007762 [Candelaria pacifica]
MPAFDDMTKYKYITAIGSSPARGQSQRKWASTATPKRPRTALFFPGSLALRPIRYPANESPGQGVQKIGMATPWLEAFPSTVKPILDEVDSLLNISLSRIIAEGPNRTLTATENSQPAIMVTSIMILRVLEKEFDFHVEEKVDVTLGHSLGEYAALIAGGYLRYDDGLRMVRRRGEVFAECSRKACEEAGGGEYGMVALVCEPGHLTSLIEAIHDFLGHASFGSKQDSAEHMPPIQQVQIGNINSKNQIVLSGSIERINTLLTQLRQFGGHDPRAVRLKSDSPFHSPLMKPAADLMRDLLSRTSPGGDDDIVTFPGLMPCISNVSARPFQSREDLKDLLARQAVETIRWWDSIRYLDQEENVRRWIGVGPGKVGRNLVGKEVGMKGRDPVKGGGVWAITDPRDVEEVMKALDETDKAEEY